MASGKPSNDPEMDKMLDEALSMYEEEAVVHPGGLDIAAAATRAVAAQQAIKAHAPAPEKHEDSPSDQALHEMLEDMKDPDFQKALAEALAQLSAASGADGTFNLPNVAAGVDPSGKPTAELPPSETIATTAAANLFATLTTAEGVSGADSLSKTLEMLQRLASNVEDASMSAPGAAAEKMSEEVMNRMIEEFERMGQKDDFNSALESTMKQLLAKDLMYMPMKQICEKFPEWLAKNRSKLSKEDYHRYGKQYQCIQMLVMTYETDPDNFPRLAALMQELQEHGNIPGEIIRDLAPGLEISPDGLPQMPGMPAMPTIPGLDGPGACVIM